MVQSYRIFHGHQAGRRGVDLFVNLAAAALADRNGRPEWGRALRTGFV